MSLSCGIIATATLLLAVIPLCARSQTATPMLQRSFVGTDGRTFDRPHLCVNRE